MVEADAMRAASFGAREQGAAPMEVPASPAAGWGQRQAQGGLALGCGL